jgi:cytochrome c oxidase subunit 3
MPVITEHEVSGGIGAPPKWTNAPGDGGRGEPNPPSFPISPKEMATWLLLTGVGMLFAGFSSAFVVLRGVPSWESIHLPSLVWSNTLVLIASSVAIEFARRAVKQNMGGALRRWLGITVGLGIIFVAGQIQVWRLMNAAGLYLASSVHSSFFYVLSSIHAVHILGGLIALTLVSYKAWSNKLSSTSFEPLRLCATYWHFMGGVWVFLLLLLVLA